MTDAADAVATRAETRTQRFRHATHHLHEALDKRMSGANLFSDKTRYALFLAMQRRFHRDIEGLYRDAALAALVPNLAERRKLDQIDQDMADVGAAPPAVAAQPVDPTDRAAALGWLYVAEGSSLGAAFLLKEAQRLDLGETFGARHLAAHPEGRGRHWRRFAEAVDAADFSPEEDARAEAGAAAAFGRIRSYAEAALSDDG